MSILFIIILSLIFLGLSAWFFYEFFGNEFNPQDLTIAHNYLKKWTMGHHELLVVDQREYEKRTKVEFIPKDVNYLKMKILGKKYRPNKMHIWVRNDMIDSFPRGTKSDERNIIVIYPPFPEDIPEYLKGTLEGRQIMERIENKRNEAHLNKVLRSSINSKDKAIEEINDGEATVEFMDKFKKYTDTAIELSFNPRKEEPKFPNIQRDNQNFGGN